jgi:hypothetical protein
MMGSNMLPDEKALEAERIAKEAIDMLNSMADKIKTDLGREATREELEYIREKVMLHFFGFYEREIVNPEKDEEDLDKPETD